MVNRTWTALECFWHIFCFFEKSVNCFNQELETIQVNFQQNLNWSFFISLIDTIGVFLLWKNSHPPPSWLKVENQRENETLKGAQATFEPGTGTFKSRGNRTSFSTHALGFTSRDRRKRNKNKITLCSTMFKKETIRGHRTCQVCKMLMTLCALNFDRYTNLVTIVWMRPAYDLKVVLHMINPVCHQTDSSGFVLTYSWTISHILTLRLRFPKRYDVY